MKKADGLALGKRWAKRGVGRLLGLFGSRTREVSVRCLMYHSIVPGRQEEPDQMTTPVDLFRQQMAFLDSEGYRVEAATTVLKRLRAGESLAPNTVVITFDDGFANNYHLAFPILRRYRFPATCFLITAALDGERARLHNLWDEEYLTWEQAREMQANGLVQFGCHSATHRNLRGLPHAALCEETEGAKRRLEQGLEHPVEVFAYPFGSYGTWDAAARTAVERAGFLGAFTTVAGINTATSDRFLLKRSRVSWCDEIPEFGRLLRGAYDWYALVQLLQAPRVRRVGNAGLLDGQGLA